MYVVCMYLCCGEKGGLCMYECMYLCMWRERDVYVERRVGCVCMYTSIPFNKSHTLSPCTRCRWIDGWIEEEICWRGGEVGFIENTARRHRRGG